MAFAQQVGFGGLSGLGWSPMQMFGGMGQNFLMGNPMMGMGMPFGMNMGGDPFSMYQMMSQFLGQNQGAQGMPQFQPAGYQQPQFQQAGYQQPQFQQAGYQPGTAQPGLHYPVWQQDVAPQQQAAGANGAGFNPDQTKSPYEQFQALKNFAFQNGSQDGTPLSNSTDRFQDMGSAEYVGKLASKQAGQVGTAIEAASPEEQKLLKATEDNLAKLFQKSADEGKPLSQQQRDLMTSTAIDNLYKEGHIKAGVGDANRKYLEMNKFQGQTEANLFLKWNLPLPAGTSKEAVDNSPFNAARK